MLVESCYPEHQLRTASPGRRMAAYAIDLGIMAATLFAGYLLWLAIAAPKGQSPGKALLGLYLMRDDGSRAGGWYTWLHTLVVRDVLFATLVFSLTFGIGWIAGGLWPLFDRERQTWWNKTTSTYVAHSPAGFVPATSATLRKRGETAPLAAAAARE